MTAYPRAFGLSHDAYGRLVLIDADGVRHVGVEPVRLFPLSAPGWGIALCDAEGRELRLVEDPRTLPETTQRLLEAELARREFVPIIERIDRIDGTQPPFAWEVQTDRGPTKFLIDSDDQVRRLGPFRALIIDTAGQRYHVPDARALDPRSRKLLDRHF